MHVLRSGGDKHRLRDLRGWPRNTGTGEKTAEREKDSRPSRHSLVTSPEVRI